MRIYAEKSVYLHRPLWTYFPVRKAREGVVSKYLTDGRKAVRFVVYGVP